MDDTKQSRVLRYLISKRDRASVSEIATNLDFECEEEVRNAIGGLRGKHGKNFIINDPPGCRSTYFRLNDA